jgi:hypothetical protein
MVVIIILIVVNRDVIIVTAVMVGLVASILFGFGCQLS